MTVHAGGAALGNGGDLSWDELFQQIDAARQEAEVDPVGKLRQMRQMLLKPPRPHQTPQVAKLKTKPEQIRPKTPGPSVLSARRPPLPMAAASGNARPMSARAVPRGRAAAVNSTGAPMGAKTARHERPSYRPAVGNGDFFHPTVQFLPNNNFDTWDKNRCALPQRAWPCQGVAGHLYDAQRLGKPDWKRGDPRGKLFGLALADIGTGIAAEQWISHYIEAHQTSTAGEEPPQPAVPAFKAEVTYPEPKHIHSSSST
eukprot:TRINITY_DN36066_c0_g1_i1.p1 TRINITY_DN36066_c0_g1~~TRINITY_DN36066_c0_g1_i1.p1  ORF type:complete len:271 (+),score=33.23 TRINITY_DN36066_c0_g1_i1:43-813(+)